MTTFLLDEEVEKVEEVEAMGSFNHGYVQMRLGSLFERSGKYTPISELTLDVRNIDLIGIQSCWLIEPAINAITVYGSITEWETYTRGAIIDPTLDIQLTVEDVFS